jgi:dTMP kinase
MVYSAAKNNPSLDLRWARQCDVGLPRPDKVIFLDLEPEDAEKRGGFGEEKYEKKEMQREVRQLFQLLGKTPQETDDMVVINAGGAVEEVAERIWAQLRDFGLSDKLMTVEPWRDVDVDWLNR